MSQACLVCGRIAPRENLFCNEAGCPGEQSPLVFDTGDRVDDLEIVRRVVVLRSAALYVAMRRGRKVYLKVAHPGADHTTRLQREARFLRSLASRGAVPPTLARWRPAAGARREAAWAETTRKGMLLSYTVFDHAEGEPLCDLLAQNPQWWTTHVGWLVSSLAETVNLLHLRGLYHLALTPESILVRFDTRTGAPRILLIDLGLASERDGLASAWSPDCAPPGYTAPELLDGVTASYHADYRTDVYGIGLILYEMLLGRPVFDAAFRPQSEVRDMVRRGARPAMDRLADAEQVAQVALQATQPDPGQRQTFAADVAAQLTTIFGVAPADRGLTVRGPYQFLRHPMYLGELVFRLALVFASSDLLLAGLLALCLAAIQVWRIRREEALIQGYDCYRRLVQWRLLPGIW